MNNAQVSPEKLAYTVPEFVCASGLGRTSVYELIKSGELVTIKVAGRRLIPRDSALRLLSPLRRCRVTANFI